MRFDGTLKRWDDERGFGFIEPAQGGQEIFAHVSAFPRDGAQPRLGEPLSFEIELNPDGKKRAVDVRRPGRAAQAAPRPSAGRPPRPSSSRSFGSRVITLVLLAGLGGYGYTEFQRRAAAPQQSRTIAPVAGGLDRAPVQAPRFSCDGRTHCSQMTSCEEATYFLKNCPGVKMDGDNDGVPCEQQLCG